MKMKKACEATGLTERAIRLYLAKNLIAPRQINGVLDFSNEDIQHLKDIALLRYFDFSIEQISSMTRDSAAIFPIVRLRAENAQAQIEHESEVHALLNQLDQKNLDSLHSLAAQIRAHRIASPEPDFSRFDEISDEFRQQERIAAVKDLFRMEKKRKKIKKAIGMAAIVAVAAALVIAFLSYPRIHGYISVSPLSILELKNDNTVTVSLDNEEVAKTIGQDTITLPYFIFGKSLTAGETIENGCQLEIQLTNLDLAQIGVHPMQSLQAQSAEINNAWMGLIIQSLFDHGVGDNAKLWIHEYTGLRPLFQQP